ncbi:hypothetical protein ACFQFC_17195 [Amorphoplanes digitatis]|uniref:Uncharacterized protein n=1 Tax=Actinoplanes digitatis TaxID=1868 RepID=A0A7W7MT29_9ACTN|nr:hypothetical protein [Actinoplanes digitatis]MBB4765951.1 hypothetical protein [Actinoplanes digitatis]GID93254.1 hypothetical protein Adi01nite_26660 [Actinoplanes digitatis]
MADQQPENPAAPAPGPAGGADAPDDPTPADGVTAARWSGSAVVPPHVPRRPWWSRRRGEDRPSPPADPWAGRDDPSVTPAVDPWADQDTPWQAELPFPEAMPPTRIVGAMPPTRIGPPLPPTRTDPPVPPAPARPPMPPASAPALGGPPAIAPTAGGMPPAIAPAAPTKRRWGRNRARKAPATAVNRLPIQPRPPAAPPQSRPAPPPAPPPWQRPTQGRPPAAPPGRRPLPPARRKRRWPRRLFLFTLVSLVCCCGVPGYLAWPAASQYPVTADLPASIADLDLREDGASRRAVERLTEELRGTSLVQGDVFAGIYADGKGKKVTVFGTTGLRLTPQEDVEAEIAHLADGYRIKDIEPYDLGETGLHERCGVGRKGGSAVVVCAWADHGSLGTVMFTRRSVAESAELTGLVRSSVLVRR